MAMSIAMKFPVAKIINEFTPEALSPVTGIGIRTLYRWRKTNKVPGKTPRTKEWRFNQLQAGADKLRAEKAAQQGAAA
jgi:hypothetical protein